MKRIIVVGGGAGGLELVTRMGNKLGRKGKAEITLIDRNQTHLWKPLLHEVATGSMDDGIDALSYRAHAHNHHFQFQQGTLINIDRERRSVTLAEIRDENNELLVPERELFFDV
ncbi:MAG: FAD-dependent oxidoreductase, partial [Plesiomonas sp.]